MKKVFTLLTIVAMGITMIGCGDEKKPEKKAGDTKPAAGAPAEGDKPKAP